MEIEPTSPRGVEQELPDPFGSLLRQRVRKPSDPILPGATIGVLGGGQLGRMFALAARTLGYRIHIYSPDYDAPAGQVADQEIVAAYEDAHRMREFARRVDVVTFEFENVPDMAAKMAAECTPVRPDGSVLHLAQNRLREKTFLLQAGFPVTAFRKINSPEDLRLAVEELNVPGILKTAGFGYDGKGQVKITQPEQVVLAWEQIGGKEAVYEAFVHFEKEVSVIAARTARGQVSVFPVFENAHVNHILDVTFCPAVLTPSLEKAAQDLAAQILERLQVVGLVTVEMFLTKGGELLVNELAPRPHNSGHLTIDACVTSQFEQQLRAICGLPLGSTALRQPAAMANLLGDLWMPTEPDWPAALELPEVKLHLYGKARPRPGRKMGHLVATGNTTTEAIARVTRAREALKGPLLPGF